MAETENQQKESETTNCSECGKVIYKYEKCTCQTKDWEDWKKKFVPTNINKK